MFHSVKMVKKAEGNRQTTCLHKSNHDVNRNSPVFNGLKQMSVRHRNQTMEHVKLYGLCGIPLVSLSAVGDSGVTAPAGTGR